jgi:hypothetical protein
VTENKKEELTYTTSPRIVHMAEPSDIAIIASISSLQLTTISISHSFRHREWQTGASKDMAAIDRADERVDKVENVGSMLCIDKRDAGG